MGFSWQGALAGFADPSYGAKLMLERQKAEAEAAQRAAVLQSFGIGGSPLQSMGGQQVAPQAMTPDDSYLQRLGGLYAQTGDSRILEQMAEYTSPGAELDRRMKEAQIANMQGENALNTTRFNNEQMDYLDRIDKQRREAQVFGTGQPDFGPSYQPPPRQGNAALPVANPNATNESLGLPNPSQIAQQAQAMLNGQQPQQAAPTSPAPDQQAQPAPQNATTATALMSYEDFVANDPRGQAAFRVDANKRDIGLTESMKAYNEYAQNQQKQADSASETQQKASADTKAASMLVQTSQPVFDNITNLIDRLEGNKTGLDRISGSWSMLPFSILPEARSAQANLEALRENLSTERLQQIKAAGFAPGTITEREWPRFESAYANLKNAQSPGELRDSLSKLRNVIVDVQNIQRRAAGMPEISNSSGNNDQDPLGLRSTSNAQNDPLGIR